MNNQRTKESMKIRHKLAILGNKRPPKTRRYCGCCLRMTTFKYNKNIGHSQCNDCGCTISFRTEENYIEWKLDRDMNNNFSVKVDEL